MIFLVAFHAKMSVLGNAVPFCIFWWNFVAVLAKGSLRLLFFFGVDDIVDDV
jgi:hypothetical protein